MDFLEIWRRADAWRRRAQQARDTEAACILALRERNARYRDGFVVGDVSAAPTFTIVTSDGEPEDCRI